MTLLTQREAAVALRLSERTLERMRVQGTGPRFVKCNRSIRYSQQDLEQWIADRVRTSTSQKDDCGIGVLRPAQ
jgi:predicted DNA-binding transcriptional regulator AlpA